MTISNLFSLSGKVALVTGASRGIGKAIALGFAGAGAKLALVARSENKLLEVQAEIKALGSEAKIFPCNLRQIERIQDLISQVIETFGQIDILVNNAGTTNGRQKASMSTQSPRDILTQIYQRELSKIRCDLHNC